MLSTLILSTQIAPEPSGDAALWLLELVKWVVEQFAAKNYVGAVAAIVMGLTFITKSILKDRLSPTALPLVSTGFGLLASIAGSVAAAGMGATPASVWGIIVTGLTTGAMASGFWSLAGKHLVDLAKNLMSKIGKKEEK